MDRRAALVALMVAVMLIIPPAMAAPPSGVMIPTYTVVPLILDNPVSSRYNRVGDRFVSHCAGMYCGGFPSGTTFVGVITEARPKHGKTPGHLNARWTEAVLPGGRRVAISGALSNPQGVPQSGATGKTAKRSRPGTGAAIGGGLGAIFGGFEGLLIGGAAGYGLGSAAKGRTTDVSINPGARYNIVLLAPAVIPGPPR